VNLKGFDLEPDEKVCSCDFESTFGLAPNSKLLIGAKFKILDWRQIQNCWLAQNSKFLIGAKFNIVDWRSSNFGAS
jgi:hypothetical protein